MDINLFKKIKLKVAFLNKIETWLLISLKNMKTNLAFVRIFYDNFKFTRFKILMGQIYIYIYKYNLKFFDI